MSWFKRRQSEPIEEVNILAALESGQMTILVGDPLPEIPVWAYRFNYQSMQHIIYFMGVLTWVRPQAGQYPVVVQLAMEDGEVGHRRILVACDPYGTRVVIDFLRTDYCV